MLKASNKEVCVKNSYEPPRLEDIGSLQQLTLVDLQDKDFGPTDGFTFNNIAISNASVSA